MYVYSPITGLNQTILGLKLFSNLIKLNFKIMFKSDYFRIEMF